MNANVAKEKKRLDDSQAIVRLSREGKRFELIAKREAVARLRQEQKEKGKGAMKVGRVKLCTPLFDSPLNRAFGSG